jgi:multidrug efflux pump subunit AcrB
VQGYVAAGLSPVNVEQHFRRTLEKHSWILPPGYHYEFGGVSAERNAAQTNLLAHFAILAVLMTASVVLAFNSFRLASLIVGVAVLSLGYGLGSLWLLHYPLGMTGIVGLMGMIGVAVNDSICVLAAIRDDALARRGNREAIVHVVVSQSRHVFATTFTTVAGALPLLLWGGDMWAPLAAVMIGGVSGATIVSLHAIPSAYVLMLRYSTRDRATPSSAQIRDSVTWTITALPEIARPELAENYAVSHR